MGDDEYAAALEAAGPVAAGPHPVNAELNARRTAAAAVLADYKATLASAPLSSPPGREWMLRLAAVLEDLLAAPSAGDSTEAAAEEESPLARRDAYIGTWSNQDVTKRGQS